MNVALLQVLEKSVNAIMAVEVPSLKVVGENKKAKELFSINNTQIRLSTLFFSLKNAEQIMSEVLPQLDYKEKVRIWDTEVMGCDRVNVPCDMEFSFVNDAKTQIFLKIRPILDNKTYYLEKFIETRKRPAFTMNKHGEYIIGIGNESFYKSFACNPETIQSKYNGEFVRFLQEEGRKETVDKIRATINRQPCGIIDVPIQTAYGDTMWLFYDTQKLKQLEKQANTLVFCLLVNKTDTIDDLTDPFDI